MHIITYGNIFRNNLIVFMLLKETWMNNYALNSFGLCARVTNLEDQNRVRVDVDLFVLYNR